MASESINDDWRNHARRDLYHREIEHFRRRQQDKLTSDVNHALIGRNASIVVIALLLLIGMSTLFSAVGSAFVELADLKEMSRFSNAETNIILMVALAVGGAMVFSATFCIFACIKLFRQFTYSYSETTDIIDEGIRLARKGSDERG
ncbi:hypothetical protein [Rhizobium hidalgonense]|uniref:hypothetical protein n=1 Tax=Rhizobium hidalgonense TaxID=1538159 RepID=UPI0011072075|nr:hypothetical protein [Rhizobium hidalgonense]QKK27502.1 hypothetical protein FFM81_029670 [Rhizobium hidalgonense]